MARRSLAHNFQAVWYGAAIMALCWPATPSEVKFAADSLLEGDGFEPSVPVKDQLVETVLFDFPAEARKRTIGRRRSQPRDLGGDLRRDHNLRDDNDRLGWGRRQAQNGGSPDGDRWFGILLLPAESPSVSRICFRRSRTPASARVGASG
jgi:hypothetical protein